MSENTKVGVIKEIQSFLEGRNDEIKYLVNIETDPKTNTATCVIHEPKHNPRIELHKYTPFIYIKDLKELGYRLYNGDEQLLKAKMIGNGISFKRMKTGNQPRLKNGYSIKVTSSKSYNHIIKFFKEGGVDPYGKKRDENGKIVKDNRGRPIYLSRHLFYTPRLDDQFFISTGARLFKGMEEYKDLHKLTFDIETTGLRYEISRIFSIGVRDNRVFETILEVEKENDDDSERRVIQDFFNTIDYVKPAVIMGFNSEMFDFEFILGRAKELGMDLSNLKTTLSDSDNLDRKPATVKFGNQTEDYMRTIMWGYTNIDILHAVKRTAAVNSDLKSNKLKYVCKFEGIAKENRMYIDGQDGGIGKMWHDNKTFIINPQNNRYIEIPDKYQEISNTMHILQEKKDRLSEEQYKKYKKIILDEDKSFVEWLRKETPILFHEMSSVKGNFKFITGKKILYQYLLDDLWETEQVDNLYNQSSFLLAKIVPTTYYRTATMGNAAVWNLLMTAWSYENDLAIPESDVVERFSGGLARCYKKGYTKRLVKIDFASLYPMIQLTWDVFPLFDITGVIKKMLTYMTTTRNIYKKLANGDELESDEVMLLKTIDEETYLILVDGTGFSDEQRNLYKVKQLPIKILNNSLFGALGSGYAFNWSDNTCAARITCAGRIYLRQVMDWFKKFGCEPLLAVTDGVNFAIPDLTSWRVTDDGVEQVRGLMPNEEAWQYKGKVGIAALIAKFNEEEMPAPYMSVDNDGEFISCLNLSRINYALLSEKKDKKTGKIKEKVKLTGNTIKSKTMPEYIEDFIDKGLELILHGKGYEFVQYYHEYAEMIYYKQVPLKKIASKSKYKNTIKDYINRGTDKNGKQKASQAHMELIVRQRSEIGRKLFDEKYDEILESGKIKADKEKDSFTTQEILQLVDVWMPPEPDLDSMIYYVNIGERKSHGDVKKNPKTGELELRCKLINAKDMEENPDMTGEYNVEKYLDAFNTRVKVLLDGFEEEVRDDILVSVVEEKKKDENNKTYKVRTLAKNMFTKNQLELKNFDHDNFDESLYLEDKEVEFWNRTGHDPNLIWDGYKISDNHKLYPEIYEFKLNWVSEQLKKVGKSAVKSVNDKINKGDYVLLKNFDDYNLGYNNGEFIEILREKMEIPKSSTELEFERLEKEEEARLEKLRIEEEKIVIEEQEKIMKSKFNDIEIWKEFKKQHGVPLEFTQEKFFQIDPLAQEFYEDFVNNYDKQEEEYFDIDEGDF